MTILIADDEPKMVKILSIYMQQEGFKVLEAGDGEEALHLFQSSKVDLAILDWMMPKVDGIQVCEYMKETSDTKVLILTAKDQDEDELRALNVGADEYIKKPFDPRIVILRAKKLLKLNRAVNAYDIRLNTEEQKAYKEDEILNLTKIEYQLLHTFMKNTGVILSRERLVDLVWGMDYEGDYRTVDTHIRRLRAKIGEEKIKTYRGLGYCMEVHDH